MTSIDDQEWFVDELLAQLHTIRSYMREEELFDSIHDIIKEVDEKMKEIQLQ